MRRPRLAGVLNGHRLSRRQAHSPAHGRTVQTYCTECGLCVSEETPRRLNGYYLRQLVAVPDCQSGSRWALEFVVRSVLDG